MSGSLSQIDLHMHTTASDGTDTPQEIVENVKAAGIKVFSVTDHDSVKAAGILEGLLSADDPKFITGVELSSRDRQGKYHILGYGYNPNGSAVQELVSRMHALRMDKVAARLDFLNSQFGFSFSQSDINALLALDNPGKPHIANLMIKYGYAKTMDGAIKEYIDRARIKSTYIKPQEVISAIIASGGIPVLAHPFYGSGDELILGADMENRLLRLMEMGIKGIEAFYSGFSEKLQSEALKLAEKYNLYITAGSDYHGHNKLVKLGENGLCEEKAYPEGLRRFLEVFGI